MFLAGNWRGTFWSSRFLRRPETGSFYRQVCFYAYSFGPTNLQRNSTNERDSEQLSSTRRGIMSTGFSIPSPSREKVPKPSKQMIKWSADLVLASAYSEVVEEEASKMEQLCLGFGATAYRHIEKICGTKCVTLSLPNCATPSFLLLQQFMQKIVVAPP